jgi:hypothetical protein
MFGFFIILLKIFKNTKLVFFLPFSLIGIRKLHIIIISASILTTVIRCIKNSSHSTHHERQFDLLPGSQ